MASTVHQVLRRASKEVCTVVRIDRAVSGCDARKPYAVTFYFEGPSGDAHGQSLVYYGDWRALLDCLLLPRMRKGGRFACVHRVNMQADHASRNAFWEYPARAKLQAKGVQVVCPLS